MMIALPEFESFRREYADLPMEGLTITAVLSPGDGVMQYDPLYLDALLAWAVVRLATFGRGVPDRAEAYDIPLPLQCVWRSPEGLPLWAASCLYPTSEWEQDVYWLHKRAASGVWSRAGRGKKGPLRIVTNMGPDMERRVPMPVVSTWELQARAIGNAEAVAFLLEQLVYLGKRRNLGTARVRRWQVQARLWEPTDVFLMDDGRLSRAVPAAASEALGLRATEPPQRVGWTPPQWKPSLFADGWRAGTEVGV